MRVSWGCIILRGTRLPRWRLSIWWGLRIVISHTYMYIIVYYDICSYHSTMRGNPRIPKMTPPKMWLSNRGVLLIPLQQLNIVSVFRRCTEARDEMRKGITGKPVKVLTAAVLQLFLEVRQALGEPGIGLPRQILAALWLQPAYRSWTPNLAPTQRSAWNVSSGSEPFPNARHDDLNINSLALPAEVFPLWLQNGKDFDVFRPM